MAAKGEEREQWGRQIEFILTMVGYAVGLGNVWRFPYLCYKNGGGAFLIPYCVCLILLGIPMFALECSFGQYGGKGPLSIWTINPALKGLGVSMVVTAIIIFIYYNIIIAWALRFLVASFTTDLPWLECKSCDCLLYDKPINITEEEVQLLRTNNSLGYPCLNVTIDAKRSSPSELFFKRDILKDSGSIEVAGEIQWELLLCNLVAFLVIFLVLLKGIQSLGKVVYFTATFPYVLLTILLVRVAMLDGAYDGVMFYLDPVWDRLADAQAWSDAAVQIFFSLSACIGGLIAMSSYNRFNNNIVRDAFVIPIINCMTSFFAGFVVFSTLGNMAQTKGVPIKDVTDKGPGLAFVIYPEAIGNMPVSTLWAILFFFMLCILGFSTQFSAAETIMTSIIDEFPMAFRTRGRQVSFRLSVCLIAFVLGIPMVTQGGQHLLDLVDGAVLGFPLLFIGLAEYVVICYIYGYNRFADDMEAMLGFRPFVYFRITWLVISPLMLLAVIVFQAYQMEDIEPAWSGLVYYLIVLFILLWIPGWFFYYTWGKGVKQIMQPEKAWTDRRRLGDKSARDVEKSEMDMEIIKDGGFANFTINIAESRQKGVDNAAYTSDNGHTTGLFPSARPPSEILLAYNEKISKF